MSPAIRAQITQELGVEPVLINSALVSAQNRQRLYWVGKRNPDGTYSTLPVAQPEDRGILLRDILESGVCWREKGYTLKAQYGKTSPANAIDGGHFPAPMVAEPVRIGTIESDTACLENDSQQYRVYSPDGKSVTLCGQGGGMGAKTGLYAVPCGGRMVGRRVNKNGHRDDYNETIERVQRFELNADPQKSNCLSTVDKDNLIIEHAPVFFVPEATAQGYAAILPGDCVDMTQPNSKTRRGRSMRDKSNCLMTSCQYYQYLGTVDKPIYEVRDGQITINGKRYPIKLVDGYYIIRKLTVTECKRLQTVPEGYTFPVSDTQAYKMLGNGWTVEVIAHIMRHIPGIQIAPVEVLSMYDGMSCGHLALDRLGAYVRAYYATEIDKYAVQTTQHNYPDTVQLGDAFQVRDPDWEFWKKVVVA